MNPATALGIQIGSPHFQMNYLLTRFEDILSLFPEVRRLAASITAAEIREDFSFEDALHRIKRMAEERNEERVLQLVMLEFYLQRLFEYISSIRGYGGQTRNNYSRLVQEIKDSRFQKKAIVVNFNYDTLFEQEAGIESVEQFGAVNESMESYISGQIKVIKMHGSYSWRYLHGNRPPGSKRTEEDFVRRNPRLLESFRNNGRIVPYHRTFAGGNIMMFPAIAIPLPGKSDFICPSHHRVLLEEEIKKIDHVLVIGWRGRDRYLIDLLKTLTQPINLTVVSGSPKTVEAMFTEFSGCRNFSRFQENSAGFSSYMASTECKTFFGTA